MELRHTNILPLFGTTWGFGPLPAIVCPWLDNGTLTSYLERRGAELEIRRILSLVCMTTSIMLKVIVLYIDVADSRCRIWLAVP